MRRACRLPRGTSLRRERADVKLVDDRLFPRPPTPVEIAPIEGRGIDDLARAMDILRLKARCRIGNALSVGKLELIERARTGNVARQLVKTM